jgi:hypothetical protein
MVSHIITLMVAPRSINVLLISVLLIYTLMSRLPGSKYLDLITPPIIKYNIFPMM